MAPLQAVQLGLAGFYAFVLPFICWGALASPGHPHARPHFVFVDPPTAAPMLPASMTMEELIAWNLQNIGCSPAVHADHADASAGALPAGQSLPKVLVGALLLLIAPLAMLGVHLTGANQFSVWLGALLRKTMTLRPTPPPPRAGLCCSA